MTVTGSGSGDGGDDTGRFGLLVALASVNLVGAWIARRDGVAGEPLGVGFRLDVRRPSVLLLWGSGLSAPLLSFPAAWEAERRRPGSIGLFGLAWVLGALSEPVLWGRRRCSLEGRVAVSVHVVLAGTIALRTMRRPRSALS